MLRKLLYLGVATFVVMTISAVAFGEAVAPQARSGNNLLKQQEHRICTLCHKTHGHDELQHYQRRWLRG